MCRWNAVLPDHFLKERLNNCLTCNESTCDNFTFFKSLAIQLLEDEMSEERTCNFLQFFMKEKGKLSPQHFKEFP